MGAVRAWRAAPLHALSLSPQMNNMTRPPDAQIAEIEALLDAHYNKEVPTTRSWELSIAHLLLAHAISALSSLVVEHLRPPPGPWSPSVESRKHGLMHAVRMLHPLASRPLRGIRASVDDALLEWADAFLSLGVEYYAVNCGFTLYHTGHFQVSDLSDTHLSLMPGDPTEAAYDFADHLFHSPQADEGDTRDFRERMHKIILHHKTSSLRHILASPEDAKSLMRSASAVKKGSWQLPPQWSFHEVQIATLRQFWTALWVIGHTVLGSGFTIMSDPGRTWKLVLWMRASELSSAIASMGDISEFDARKILNWHTYDRGKAKSDIALTPFVETGAEYLMTSPELLSTSRFERNFYANAARTSRLEIDKTSHLLAPQMASDLAAVLEKRNFKTAAQVSFRSSKGSGDVDLLIWSPAEQGVLALELKWFVAPADYREVLNLLNKAEQALRDQLPKYRCALSEDIDGLLRRAFGVDVASTPKFVSAGLLMRNYAGHARLRRYPSWFAPEAAFLHVLSTSKTLADVIFRMENFLWLPQLGKDFELATDEIVSPGGMSLSVPAYRIPSERLPGQVMPPTRPRPRARR